MGSLGGSQMGSLGGILGGSLGDSSRESYGNSLGGVTWGGRRHAGVRRIMNWSCSTDAWGVTWNVGWLSGIWDGQRGWFTNEGMVVFPKPVWVAPPVDCMGGLKERKSGNGSGLRNGWGLGGVQLLSDGLAKLSRMLDWLDKACGSCSLMAETSSFIVCTWNLRCSRAFCLYPAGCLLSG